MFLLGLWPSRENWSSVGSSWNPTVSGPLTQPLLLVKSVVREASWPLCTHSTSKGFSTATLLHSGSSPASLGLSSAAIPLVLHSSVSVG